MEIKHRISINSSDAKLLVKIDNFGINYNLIELPGKGGNFITFNIFESDPHWNEVINIVKTHKNFAIYDDGDIFETLFSEEEIRNADWLRFKSTFEQGYPQPKLHWPIKQLSYNLICNKCAIHSQTASMRIIREPNLGRKSFMSLMWTNEILCKPEVLVTFETIGIKGYEVWDVLIHKTSIPSEKIKQIYIPNIATSGFIINNDLKQTVCPICGTIKYYPHEKGVMRLKKEAINPNVDFILTNEWFGSGYIAYREILVSNRVANLFLDKGYLGVRFKVVEII
jgi:hypothetical protein